MKSRNAFSVRLVFCAVAFVFALTGASAAARDFKFEAQLVWATTSETSPDPNHKPVNEETRKKLAELPLKWKHYFLVRKDSMTLPLKTTKDVVLSDKCRISVKDVDGKNFEVALVGKGESVLKRTQTLAKGEMLVLGGNAPDSTGWLVTLKRVE